MKIAICDDEEIGIRDIDSHIKNYGIKKEKLFYVDTYLEPSELLKNLTKVKYDLIYLDIEMNNDNGIVIAEQIHIINPNCMIIFVTAHMQYFHDSFHVNAFQYLVKPLKEELFEKELERAIHKYKSMKRSLILPTTQGNIVLDFQEIIYIETSYREYKVHCPEGYHYGNAKAFQKIKNFLADYHFFRIQRSYLVNFNHIKQFNGDAVVMSNGDTLVISRKQMKMFKQEFFTYIGQ